MSGLEQGPRVVNTNRVGVMKIFNQEQPAYAVPSSAVLEYLVIF